MNFISRLFGFTLFDVKRNGHNKSVFKWHYGIVSVLLWVLLIPFLLLQFIGLFILINQLGTNKRKISTTEIKELDLVFADSVDYSKIRIRENSIWAKFGARYIKSAHLGFVFLNTIHFSRTIDTENNVTEMAWLVHEVTHISQYQKLGIVYMVKALRAQRNGGYMFEKAWLTSELKDFNFEQQADIAKAYFLEMKEETANSGYQSVINLLKQQKFC